MSFFQNYCGGRLWCCAVLTPSPTLHGMSQSLRSMRLISGLPRDIFKEAYK